MPDITIVNFILFLVGLLVIIKGSDFFLEKAIWLARACKISEMLIGSTLVSLCTTLPEMMSAITASIRQVGDMAVGNAVGSVICNTGLILGILLVFTTVSIRREIFMLRGVFMLGTLAIGYIVIISPTDLLVISRGEGAIFLVVLTIYLVVNYYESLHEGEAPLPAGGVAPLTYRKSSRYQPSAGQICGQLGLFFLAALIVIFGAWLLVEFGQKAARDLGVSEAVIALVFISFGTSLPELFTAIAAIRRNSPRISVGNIFGANILNMSLVVGASAAIKPLRMDDAFLRIIDIPFALALGVVAFAVGIWKGRAGRYTGFFLLSLYGFYLISMFLTGRIRGGL